MRKIPVLFLKSVIFLLICVILLASFGSSVQALPLAQNTGNMDLNGYCKYLGYSGVRLDPTQKNVNSWGCLRSDGTQVGMDLYDLCSWQYGNSLPVPKYSNYNDPYSWYCSAVESDLLTPQQTGSDNSEGAGACLDANYEELALEVGSLQIFISGGGVLRASPSFSAEIVKILPRQDVNAPYIDGPRCSYGTDDSSSTIVWWKVNVGGVVGWNSDWDPAYYSNSSNSPSDSGGSVLPEQPNSTNEEWSTSISQCGVNPLLYEFYKDQENILKLVLVHNPSGFLGWIQNILDHIGLWIDLGKTKFEPVADEVYVTLRYSSLGNYEAQVYRYLQGQLLSSEIYPLNEATYMDYQDKLEACGIIT